MNFERKAPTLERDETYVVKSLTPIERQRRNDGTPITINGLRPLPVGPTEFVLKSQTVEKSQKTAKVVYDADAVVKSFMEKGCLPGLDTEDEEKSMTEKVGQAALSGIKTAVGAVSTVANKR